MSDTVQLTIKLRDYILNKFGAFLETTVEVLSKAKEYTKENMFEVLFLLLLPEELVLIFSKCLLMIIAKILIVFMSRYPIFFN